MKNTLVHLLESRAAQHGARNVFHFLTEGEVDGPWESMSPESLARAARAIGAQLVAEGAQGQPVLLLMPPGLELVRAFFGCLYAGAIAVPVYPPEPHRPARGLERLRGVRENCRATRLLTTAALSPLVEGLLEGVSVLASDLAPAAPTFQPLAGEVALLQYTSGSTRAPRGVVLGHEQLLRNAEQIAKAFGVTGEMRLVSWLPPYHDMGLIGGILQPLYLGAEVLGLSPVHFLQQPRRWLEAIARFRADTSGGPNFAFELLARRIAEPERLGLDLSSWRVAFNGAEPIRAETQRRFAESFAPCGFRATSFVPCYGLAEATLLVAAAPPGRAPHVHVVDSAALEQRVVRSASGGGRELVSCGFLAEGVELAVVDPETRTRVAPHGVGELWLRGPNVAQGYFRDAEQTAEVFGAQLEGRGGWLRTGDLGALVDGELVVTGRAKDLLIVNGRNLYPQDVEATVTGAHPRVRAGNVVAFASADEGVCVVAEVRDEGAPLPDVLDAIHRAVLASHDVAPQLIALATPGSVRKTSSGKLARSATREALERGELTPLASRARTAEIARGPLYVGLFSAFRRLDARSTRYRFDVELDIPWSRLSEPGDYYPGALLESYGYDVAAIQGIPGAWELFQWRTALSIASGFDLLEQALLGFAEREARHFHGVRSVALLCEEERKHIELFQRLSAHLRSLRPELGAEIEAETQALRGALQRFAEVEQFPSLSAYHYCWWLLILFFEELTVWLGGALSATERVQPTWLAAHRAHAREETQHVLTDFAFLLSLNASEEERSSWSTLVFEQVVPKLALTMSPDAALRLTLAQFPSLPRRGRVTTGTQSPFAQLLSRPEFSRTRAAAPHLARTFDAVRSPLEASGPDAPELERWICDWVAQVTGVRPARHDQLQAAGLDSVGALSLSGALEQKLGARLPGSSVYDYPTPATLARFARTRSEASHSAASTATAEPLLARQRRLLGLDRRHPAQVLDHLSAVFTLPASDAPRVAFALRRIVQRHPGLWSRYLPTPDGTYVAQRLPADALFPLVIEEREPDDAALARRAAELDNVPFELATAPPFRAELWQGSEQAALLVALHHVCADGWSLEVLLRELVAECRGEAVAAPRSTGLEREQARLTSADAAARLEHWQKELSAVPDCARPTRPISQQVQALSGELTRSEWEQVEELARRSAATPYVVMLTAFCFAWRSGAGGSDQLVAAHLFNRVGEDERSAINYLVNVLTLRSELEPGMSFRSGLERVRQSWLQALDQELPIDHVVRHVFPERYLERWMPARVAFNLLLAGSERQGEWRWRHDLAAPPRFLFFDGMFVVLPDSERLRFTFWYDAQALSTIQADALVRDFKSLLLGATPAPEAAARHEVGAA